MLNFTRNFGHVIALAVLATLTCVALVVAGEEIRTWSDATGKFKIEARFVAQDKGKVTLEGKDGKRFEIEVAKLSPGDQKHLAELGKKPPVEDPFKPVSPAKRVTPDWTAVRLVDMVPANLAWKVTVKPAPALTFKSMAVGLPARVNFFEGCHALVVNPISRRALVGYQWGVHNAGKDTSRMLLCDIENGKVLSQFTLDGLVTPLALDDDGAQGLFKRNANNKDQLEIWSLSEKGSEKVAEFSAADAKGQGHDIRWAVFLDKKRLLTDSYHSGMVVMWDLPSLKPSYQVMIQGSSVPALSHDRKLLAFTTGSQLGILDVDAGKVLALRPTPGTPFASLAFSPGGKWLACGSHAQIFVWDVATGELHRDIAVKPLDVWGSIAWPNDRMMLIGNKSLMDLDLAYRFWEFKGHNHVQTYGEQSWFVTHEAQGALIPAVVPDPTAMQALEKALPNMVLKPGTVVKLDVSALPDAEEAAKAAKALEAQLKKNGCTVGADGTIELIASTDLGKEIEIGFVPAGTGGGGRFPGMPFIPKFGPKGIFQPPSGLPPGTKVRIVKMQEHFARLKFIDQGKTVWESSADNLPKSVKLAEGETLEQHLKKLEKTNYAFYQTVELPRLLHRDKGTAVLGTSQVSVSGVR